MAHVHACVGVLCTETGTTLRDSVFAAVSGEPKRRAARGSLIAILRHAANDDAVVEGILGVLERRGLHSNEESSGQARLVAERLYGMERPGVLPLHLLGYYNGHL